jgi:hypothetical protein
MHNGFLIEIKREEWDFINRTNFVKEIKQIGNFNPFSTLTSHSQEKVKYIPLG